MKLLNFTIIKLTICLVIGILLGNYFKIALPEIIVFSSSSIIFYAFGALYANRKLNQPIWVGFCLLITMISIGVLTTKFHNQIGFKNHFTNHKSVIKDPIYEIQFRVREILKPNIYYNKYVIDIIKINNTSVTGKSLLNIEKDFLSNKLQVDDIIITKGQLVDIGTPLNPHQFNYKNYLKKKNIYRQLFNKNSPLLKIDSTKHTLFGYAALIRERVNNNLKSYNINGDELSIINALLLGQRQDISKDIYDSYAQAGAIHILAVSGLHVGVILLLLNYLFKPLEYIKHGKLIKTGLLIIILWSFAIIAGLSASVVRAVTMFTAVAIAINWKRPTNIYNTLAISMFVLLLCNPNFLFDVGFQLSYLAVFAIVFIQPMLYRLYKPKFKLDKLLWNVLSVTIAAQFGVLPISLFYFHQFPGLFIVSNLVIIPFLSLILGFGILVITLSLINLLPNFLAELYGKIIHFMNLFVNWISNQEAFIFKNISFNLTEVILSYLLIIGTILFLKRRTYKHLATLLVLIIAIQGYFFYEKFYTSNKAFIVFNKSRYSILGFKHNSALSIHHNLPQIENENSITNYKVGENLNIVDTIALQNLYTVNTKTILVIDSLGVYNINGFKVDIILLRNSPKINLLRLIDSLKPELIISDGSNFKSYQTRWAKTCRIRKLPFHQTSVKGAFIYKY